MSDRDRWRDAMGEMMAIDRYAPAGFTAPSPQGSDLRLPDVSIESRSTSRPAVEGSIGLGDMDLRGSYYRPSPNAPASWYTKLGYRRSF